MDDLPDGERAVLELVALDGTSPKEAAQVLGIRDATARIRLHRARARLRVGVLPLASLEDSTAEVTS